MKLYESEGIQYTTTYKIASLFVGLFYVNNPIKGKVHWWLALVRIVGLQDPILQLEMNKFISEKMAFAFKFIHVTCDPIFNSRPPLWSIPNVSVHASPI